MNLAEIRRLADQLRPPVLLVALDVYEEVSRSLDAEFPDAIYGWSPFVPDGQVIVVNPPW